MEDNEDLALIIEQHLIPELKNIGISKLMINFLEWFTKQTTKAGLSLRDVLNWVLFMNRSFPTLGKSSCYLHGAMMVTLDGLGITVQSNDFFKRYALHHNTCPLLILLFGSHSNGSTPLSNQNSLVSTMVLLSC